MTQTAENSPPLAAGCVVSAAPLITVSKCEPHLPLGLASFAPERFDGPSLNFLGLTWSHESSTLVERVAANLTEAERKFPKARFVILANTPSEQVQFSRAGIANMLANELIFVDERLFVPAPPGTRVRRDYDAVYVARLSEGKRHDLAKAVDNLLLLYGQPDRTDLKRVRAILPSAVFANHDLKAGGGYYYFDEKAMSAQLIQCAVGLCLSPVEGAMRASLEYRLCGLPVVSIQSDGGRDRYLLGPHVRIADAEPEAIAAAVRDLKAQTFDPFAVREYVGRLVAFDRHNFLLNVNKIAEQTLGLRQPFPSFLPFARYPVTWRSVTEIFAPLD